MINNRNTTKNASKSGKNAAANNNKAGEDEEVEVIVDDLEDGEWRR